MLSFCERLAISTTRTHESEADSRNERAVFAQRTSRKFAESGHFAGMDIYSELSFTKDDMLNNRPIRLFYAFAMPDFAAELTASRRDELQPWCLRPQCSTVPPLNSAANSAVADRHRRSPSTQCLVYCSSQLDSRPDGQYCLRIAARSLKV